MVDNTTLFAGGVLSGLMNRNRGQASGAMYNDDAYNSEMNTSEIRKKIDYAARQRVETMVNEKMLENLESGRDRNEGTEELRASLTEKKSEFYLDELRDIVEQSRNATRKSEVDGQIDRLNQTLLRMKKSDISDQNKQFLTKQFTKAGEGLQTDVKGTKQGYGGALVDSAKSQVSNYMDMRSMFAGLVDNNPLLMGLFGIGADMTRKFTDDRKRKKNQLRDDEIKEGNLNMDVMLENREKADSTMWDEMLGGYDPVTPFGGGDTPSERNQDENSTQAEQAQDERMQERAQVAQAAESEAYREGMFERLDSIIELLGGDKKSSMLGDKEEPGLLDKYMPAWALDPKKILKMVGKAMKGLGIAAMIASLVNGLYEGITAGWNTWLETGSLSEAIMDGANNLLSGMTFGLIDPETFEAFFTDVGNWIGKKVFDMVEAIKGFFSNMIDEVAEWIPGWDSKREKQVESLRQSVLSDKDPDKVGLHNDVVDPDKVSKLSDTELEVLKKEYQENGGTLSAKVIREEQANRVRAEASFKKQKAADDIVNRVNDVRMTKGAMEIGSAGDVAIQNNQTTNINQSGDNGTNALPLSSARNPDSTVQRLSERMMGFGLA